MPGIYHDIYLKGDYNPENLLKSTESLRTLSSEDAYWLAKCLLACTGGEKNDRKIIECLRYAFNTGINYSTKRELFLDGAKILSCLYMRCGDYHMAVNYLMNLVERLDTVPDWVNVSYLLAQVMTDNILRIAEDPYFFFKRLDSISPESEIECSLLYSVLLERLKELSEKPDGSNIDLKRFMSLQSSYLLEETEGIINPLEALLGKLDGNNIYISRMEIQDAGDTETVMSFPEAIRRDREEYLQKVNEVKQLTLSARPIIIVRKNRD